MEIEPSVAAIPMTLTGLWDRGLLKKTVFRRTYPMNPVKATTFSR
jgi:hypothetical protein